MPIRLGVFSSNKPNGPLSATTRGQLGNAFERRLGGAEMAKQAEECLGTNIFAADEPQPVQAFSLGQRAPLDVHTPII